MKLYRVECERLGLSCLVKASSRKRARFTAWDASRRAGYRMEFGDFDVSVAGEKAPADVFVYVSASDEKDGLAA